MLVRLACLLIPLFISLLQAPDDRRGGPTGRTHTTRHTFTKRNTLYLVDTSKMDTDTQPRDQRPPLQTVVVHFKGVVAKAKAQLTKDAGGSPSPGQPRQRRVSRRR